jgi:ferredoxin
MSAKYLKSLHHALDWSRILFLDNLPATLSRSIVRTSQRRRPLPYPLSQNYWRRELATLSSTPTTIPIIFEYSDGEVVEIQAELGKNYLHVAQANGIDLEGACGGELACATCHLIFDPDVYETLPPKAEEEEDMLDLAFGLTKT